MLELLLLLLGLNFGNTNAAAPAAKFNTHHTATMNLPANADPDTGGETQPIPPKK